MARPRKEKEIFTKRIMVRMTERHYIELEYLSRISHKTKAQVIRDKLDDKVNLSPANVHREIYLDMLRTRNELRRQGGLIKKTYSEHPDDPSAIRQAWHSYVQALEAVKVAVDAIIAKHPDSQLQ